MRPQVTPPAKTDSEDMSRQQCHTIQYTRLGVWMDAHPKVKEQRNRCIGKGREAEARLRTLTTTYGIVPQSVGAIQVA